MDQTATLAAATRLIDSFLTDLRATVDIDSGSYTPAGVTQVADYLQPRFAALGCAVERVPGTAMGPHLVARLRGQGQGRVLLVGHMDTVFPEGEVGRRPFSIRDGRAYGPGVLDMKGGLLVALYALRLLAEAGEAPFAEVTAVFNSDEEIGSPESTPLVTQLAEDIDAALVLEPSAQMERTTVRRKGVGIFRIDVTGVSSHAGADPERGRNAILELAHRIVSLQALNGVIDGVTVNVGVVAGGQRPNVVPDAAHAEIDIRVVDLAGLHSIERALHEVAAQTTIAGTSTTLSGKFMHEPFEQSERSVRLFTLAEQEASALGLTLRGEMSGGGSDGNTTARLGVATLDGLGVVGGLAHNPGEYVEVASIAPRIALLAGLLRRIDASTATLHV